MDEPQAQSPIHDLLDRAVDLLHEARQLTRQLEAMVDKILDNLD